MKCVISSPVARHIYEINCQLLIGMNISLQNALCPSSALQIIFYYRRHHSWLKQKQLLEQLHQNILHVIATTASGFKTSNTISMIHAHLPYILFPKRMCVQCPIRIASHRCTCQLVVGMSLSMQKCPALFLLFIEFI